MLLAQALAELKRFEEAERVIDRVMRQAPDTPGARATRAHVAKARRES